MAGGGTHTGGCLCGQVRYAIAAEPVGARSCWCRDCQKIASGSATVNLLVPADAVSFTGEISVFERVADSGNTVHRGFCPKCGSQLYSRSVNAPDHPLRIRIGTLDDPELLAPQATIWTDSAPSWAPIDESLPRFAKGPPPA